MNEPKYTTNDLNKAIGQLLIVLGAHLPEATVKSMSAMLNDLSGQIKTGGEPTVAKLTAGFAGAMEDGQTARKSRQH